MILKGRDSFLKKKTEELKYETVDGVTTGTLSKQQERNWRYIEPRTNSSYGIYERNIKIRAEQRKRHFSVFVGAETRYRETSVRIRFISRQNSDLHSPIVKSNTRIDFNVEDVS